MTDKELKIKEAYGQDYEYLKEFINNNGYLNKEVFDKKDITYDEIADIGFVHPNNLCCIPESIFGIDTNNGWVKIESEDDLPNKHATYEVFNILYPNRVDIFCGNLLASKGNFTHYKEYKKSNPPIY